MNRLSKAITPDIGDTKPPVSAVNAASAGASVKTGAAKSWPKGARERVEYALAIAEASKKRREEASLPPPLQKKPIMVEVGTCGNLHILDLVDTIRKNIGYHIVEQKFPDNVLLATGDVEGKSNELPGMVPLDDISALYKGMALEASRQRGYDQPVLPLRNDPEARLQESNYWEFDVMREGLERLQTIGWIVGEVEAGNMGVTEVFKIFERTWFHKDFLTNQLYRMLLELTVRALERPDAQQVAIARRVGEWITGRDFTPNEECRMLRTKVLARVAQLEAIPGGIPTKRAGAKTGDNRSGRRSEKRKQKKEGKAK